MTPMPKPLLYRDPKYLRFIRSRGCLVCGKKAEPHHVRRYRWGAGTSQKPHDYVAIPLCREHHDEYEKVERKGVELVIIDLLMEYINDNW